MAPPDALRYTRIPIHAIDGGAIEHVRGFKRRPASDKGV